MRTRLQPKTNQVWRSSSGLITRGVLQHKSDSRSGGRSAACNQKAESSLWSSPTQASTRVANEPGLGHDFGKLRIHFDNVTSAGLVNDQTQSGGLSEEFMKGGTAAEETPTQELNLGKEETQAATTPVIDQIELVSSKTGAVGGYQEKEDTCDASLNQPGPFNDTSIYGSVANVHQIQFHLSQGDPGDLRASRIVKRTAEGRGQKFAKSGNDGPPNHEYRFTKDKLVIADAPGWCTKLKESDFPVNYSADFALYAWDAPTQQILASLAYHVEINKTHFSQGDPLNTVSVTEKKIGGVVPAPVKPKK